MRTYCGMLGYVGQPTLSTFDGYTPIKGDDYAAAIYRLKRVVRSAAALSGEKATIYALHDGLPPMAALRVTSNGGSAPLLREVPLAVAGHTPSLASVQWLAHALSVRLGRIRVAMGFGPAADSGLHGKTLETVALGVANGGRRAVGAVVFPGVARQHRRPAAAHRGDHRGHEVHEADARDPLLGWWRAQRERSAVRHGGRGRGGGTAPHRSGVQLAAGCTGSRERRGDGAARGDLL